MNALRLVAVLALAAAACGKSKSESSSTPQTRCDKYAAMEVKCSGHSGEDVRAMAKQFCESSAKDKDSNVMAAMISLEADCAETETECDAYKACVEKKKSETTPPGL